MKYVTVALIAGAVFASFGTQKAEARNFTLSKSDFQKCALSVTPGKEHFLRIGQECASPFLDMECRSGNGNSGFYWTSCPPAISLQMERWIKVQTARLRKAGGQKAKDAAEIMREIGDGKTICKAASQDQAGGRTSPMQYCRAVLLAQTYGFLYFIEARN